MIGLDTFDKMVEVATEEVFKEHRRLKGAYPKSLNDALSLSLIHISEPTRPY